MSLVPGRFPLRALVQRVSSARVTVEGRVTGEIGRGLLVLLGVAPGDDEAAAVALAGRVARLRVFADGNGKMSLALAEVGGAALSVSQFTLYADTRRGNRPSFTGAAPAGQALALYRAFNAALRRLGLEVQEGEFGADMQVMLVNDGPVTLLLDTAEPGAGQGAGH